MMSFLCDVGIRNRGTFIGNKQNRFTVEFLFLLKKGIKLMGSNCFIKIYNLVYLNKKICISSLDIVVFSPITMFIHVRMYPSLQYKKTFIFKFLKTICLALFLPNHCSCSCEVRLDE